MQHTNHETLPTATVHAELRLKRGLRITRTRTGCAGASAGGWNIWDDFAEDTVKRHSCRSLVELLEWIGDDSMLVTDVTNCN